MVYCPDSFVGIVVADTRTVAKDYDIAKFKTARSIRLRQQKDVEQGVTITRDAKMMRLRPLTGLGSISHPGLFFYLSFSLFRRSPKLPPGPKPQWSSPVARVESFRVQCCNKVVSL